MEASLAIEGGNIMVNPKDNSRCLALPKAHGTATSPGKNGFKLLKTTCKMAGICSR